MKQPSEEEGVASQPPRNQQFDYQQQQNQGDDNQQQPPGPQAINLWFDILTGIPSLIYRALQSAPGPARNVHRFGQYILSHFQLEIHPDQAVPDIGPMEPINPVADPQPTRCPVCFETVAGRHPIVTPCGHVFCMECLRRSLQHNSNCPLCRNEINRITRIYE